MSKKTRASAAQKRRTQARARDNRVWFVIVGVGAVVVLGAVIAVALASTQPALAEPAAEPVIVNRIATPEAIFEGRAAVRAVHMDGRLKDYIVRLVFATREPDQFGLGELRPLIAYGASPRATIFTGLAARGHAFLDGRDYVLPDDIKDVALDVMRHRVVVSYQAEAEEVTAESVIARVLDRVPVP